MIYIYAPAASDADAVRTLLKAAMPEADVAVWPEAVDPCRVRYAVVWSPPADFFAPFTHLEAVFTLGAGVDKLLTRSDLPSHTPIVRLLDAGMAPQMVEYVLYGVLRYQRQFDLYQQHQHQRQWQPQAPRLAADVRVGVLGLGQMGGAVAAALAGLGYRVSGWSRSTRQIQGVRCLDGDAGLLELVRSSDVLVNILPSTPQTRLLLNHQLLGQLPQGAALINAGRGDQLDISALLDLLESGHLRYAQLDVFSTEPLPADSPLWARSDVVITPHVAAATLMAPAVSQIVHNLDALKQGLIPEGLVDRQRGY